MSERRFSLYDPTVDGLYNGSLSDPRRTFQWLKWISSKLSVEHRQVMKTRTVLPNLSDLDELIDQLDKTNNKVQSGHNRKFLGWPQPRKAPIPTSQHSRPIRWPMLDRLIMQKSHALIGTGPLATFPESKVVTGSIKLEWINVPSG